MGSAAGFKFKKISNQNPNLKKSEKTKAAISSARAKTHTIIFPDGHKEQITNLSKFCKELGIKKTNFYMSWGNQGYSLEKV